MLKSNEALVPCRNLSFGNRLLLIAMEKAAAVPLRLGLMPNSPMPMLDVCDALLLMTVSTTGGGSTGLAPVGVCWLPLLPPCCLLAFKLPMFIFILLAGRVMFVGVEKLCACVVLLC